MALVLKDRVQETTTTSGTGTLTLLGAVSGFDTFSASIGNGNVTYYTIFDNTAYVWEVGIGTVGAGTLARTTVLSNSSGTTSPINLAGNVAFVFCTYPAEKSINYDTNDVATIGETLGYSDSGIIASFASTVAGYNQVVLQNKSTATNASTNFNVSNDAGTAGSNYAELGINSSTFTGTGSFNIAGASYVASASTDLTLGTYGAYSIHFVTNSGTTDAMTIFNNGGISLGGFSNPGIGNMAASKFVPGYTSVTSAAGTTVLTASSNYYQNLLGTTTQTFQLPDATGLLVGTTFIFDNDSTGTLTVVDNASGPIDTIPGGALGYVYLANNSTVAGTWRRHAFLPASYDFNSTTANFGNATITNAVWNGTTIASGYGGTGLTTFTGANNALYSTNATTLVAGTLPVAAGGTGLTSLTTGRIPYGDGTNPFGSSANLFWDSANNWLGIGTSAPSQKVTINSNTVLPSVGAPGTSNIWVVGADSVTNLVSLDSFNAQCNVIVRRANGTAASPTALAANNVIFQFAARGYGATGYTSGGRAQFTFDAAENWTDTAQGTFMRFNTTQIGTTSLTEKMRILDSGAISFGSGGTAYGTSGQVLTSNGNATPTWTSLSSSAVTSFSAGTTGFTPNSATTGAVTLAGTLNVANGGTGATTATAAFDALNPMTTVGDMIYEGTGPTATRLPIGSTGQVLTVSGGIPSWATPSSNVSSISFGSTGLTPSTTTTGAVTVAGTLAVTNGGTGATTAPNARTNLGATTVGSNLFTLTNPSAVTFPRFNADNTVSVLDDATFRTAIGAGTGNGTVTSVAALTLGTTGTDLSSTVATGTTTPVITLNVPTASATNRGALSSTDWTTFNNKGNGTVTSVSFTGGIISVATATTTPALTVAGTSGGIPYFSSASTWASSGALAANALVIGGGAGAAPATTTTGTGVLTALGIAVNTTAGGLTTIDGTATLTNKRVTSRVTSITGAAGGTITPTGDTADQYNITALGAAATLAIPSGTPTDGQKLSIRIKDNGTGRALTWTTSAGGYRVIGTTLPTTTTASKTIYVGCVYNSADSFWDVVAVSVQA